MPLKSKKTKKVKENLLKDLVIYPLEPSDLYRPRFDAILERMVLEKIIVKVSAKRDFNSLYQQSQRVKIRLWIKVLKSEEAWLVKVAEPNEDCPFSKYKRKPLSAEEIKSLNEYRKKRS